MKKTYSFILILLCSFFQNSYSQGLSFAENKGQWNNAALFRAEIPGGAMFISNTGPVYHFAHQEDLEHIHDHLMHNANDPSLATEKIRKHAYQLQFINSNKNTTAEALNKTAYLENFFIGNDQSKWASNVKHFKTIKQHDIFENIDLIYYAQTNNIKYDFVVKPGAKVSAIQMQMKGADVHINKVKQLVINTSVNTVIEDVPYAFQIISGDTIPVDCHYALNKDIISFEVEKYNTAYPLIIDPDLIFATYSGAVSASFYSYTSTYDYAGNTIIAALGFGMGWPTSLGAYNAIYTGATDVAILKLTPDGSTRLFGTYLGGSGSDYPYSLSTNYANHIYVIGNTTSSDFPVGSNALQSTYAGNSDIFISKISMDGSTLMGSTYLGGSNADGNSIYNPIVGSSGNKSSIILKYNEHDHSIWFSTSTNSTNFPTTVNAMQANHHHNGAILAQVDSNLSQLLYSSYYNANNDIFFHDIKISNTNKIYLSGNTSANNMGTPGTLHPSYIGGNSDGIILKFNPTSKSILACTYLGTTNTDIATKLAIQNPTHNLYISGSSNGNYPVTTGAFSQVNSVNYIQIIDSNLSNSIASTVFGGAMYLSTSDVFINSCSAFGIAGIKAGNTFPITPNAFSTTGEFWLGNFSTDLSNVLYGTYYGYGGHTHSGTFNFDTLGNIHHSVCDIGGTFVTTPNAWSLTKQTSSYDMISFKFDISTIDKYLDFELAPGSKDTACTPNIVSFVNNSYNFDYYVWDFGDGTSSNDFAPSKTYTLPGIYKVKLTGFNPSCNFHESDSMYIVVKASQIVLPYVSDTTICSHVNIMTLAIDSIQNNHLLPFYAITWEPALSVIGNNNGLQANINPHLSNEMTIHFTGLTNDTLCLIDTFVKIHINHYDSSNINVVPALSHLCKGDSVLITATGGNQYTWEPNTYLQFINNNTAYSKPQNSITYTISIVDTHHCNYERTSEVVILDKNLVEAGPDIIVKYGEQAKLMGSTNASQFYWEYENTQMYHNELSPVLYPTDTMLFYLRTISNDGCSNYDSMYVYVNNIKIPNAFTPNGDGLNDIFYPIPKNAFAEIVNFSIYNRYGQRIFYAHKLYNGWNGTQNGATCDAGVYIYYVEYKIGGKSYFLKGDVTLIR